jgi:hypothetical protein
MLVGIGLIVVSGVAAAAKRGFVKSATASEGVVVRLNAGGSHPEIEFTTAAGRKVSYPQGGFIFGYRPGQKVRVLYLADAPAQTASVDAFGALWFVPVLLTVIGLFLIIAGASSRFEITPSAR